ncbi:MAG: aconitate hydratase AcnA [Deltaproteobacteria bacterium CG_4_9_14_3_um_filter_63_12]|nr:MAG: aconitate hydratase AcnA [Deltaproteobacteria bacterium CG_4_9_14_3_um_filter_63_12]
MSADSFGSKTTMTLGGQSYTLFALSAVKVGHVSRLPFSLKILLENLLRFEDGSSVSDADIAALAAWGGDLDREIAYRPARVLLQDFTGVPAVVDLAAMRDALVELGGDASQINPLQPVDLVIDHSVQVDRFGSAGAFAFNAEREFERNGERYAFLRWGQGAFDNFRVVPPDTGIVHQVNLEYLAPVLFETADGTLYPDTLVGTDSHTTMICGLGVIGWGVGGIEAEAAMLGQPVTMLVPKVTGFKLMGRLPEGATATDLVLTVTRMLRDHGVVERFVEFFGPGLDHLPLPDRATIANMCPEYGATVGFFPVDAETLSYLRFTGRDEAHIERVEAYMRKQGLFRETDTPDPIFTDVLELDMSTVVPSISGPRLPQQLVPLSQSKPRWREALGDFLGAEVSAAALSAWKSGAPASGRLAQRVAVEHAGQRFELGHGAVAIAAITSCTNTSNPSVMLGAGLLAKKAVELGLSVKPWVKTSLAPGSKVVTEYLEAAGLTPYLEALKFHLVGYGCTTCIGNSGPLPGPIDAAIKEGQLVACAVLSGNRNFEGRIGPAIRANYLASPPLVVAYALAGTLDIDLATEPLGTDPNGTPVFLADVWPSSEEIQEALHRSLSRQQFVEQYAHVFEGDASWRGLPVPEGQVYDWQVDSTYVRLPPYFVGMSPTPGTLSGVTGARVLAVLGDAITTDHISPAGSIAADSPAGRYLEAHGVSRQDFNSYGSRRGNHEVMMRGTFANIRLRNKLAPGTEGGWTTKLPEGQVMSLYDAAMAYKDEGVPLVILAGTLYGSGSSRDWAAKGPALQGVRVVIAQSYERIHRSNLVGMGILPLQFLDGEGVDALGLTGRESFAVSGLSDDMKPGERVTVGVTGEDGSQRSFEAVARVDTPVEVEYLRHGGILQYVLRALAKR